MEIRVRFAPSPTGPLHLGGVRTALYNYLFAKKNNGKLILRIEDTDGTRFVEGAQEYIEDAFAWCGIEFDESPKLGGKYAPYVQSERKDIYQKYIKEILESGNAYYAFDTAEELDEIRKEHEKTGKVFSYNSYERTKLKNSLTLPQNEVQELLHQNIPYVIRFKTPENRIILLQDIIRGNFSVNSETLDDKVLMKSDGTPTYHFANIVDDHLMEISHVIRGEEWLPSLPLHSLLYESFGWKAPTFAHLPLILKPEGNGKLSKRDGDKFGFPVFPLEWRDVSSDSISLGYREQGYFSEAFINMLLLLGWSSSDDKEIYSLEEMIQVFDLEKVHKAGARFNLEKTKWFNREYLLKKSDEELAILYQNYLTSKSIPTTENDAKIVSLLKDRVHFIAEIYEEGKFFYQKPEKLDEKAYQKVWKDDTQTILNQLFESLETITWQESEIHNTIQEFSKTNAIGLGKILAPIRLKLVGELKGPDVPLIMEILGKKECKERVL